jgi:hypothetical protein
LGGSDQRERAGQCSERRDPERWSEHVRRVEGRAIGTIGTPTVEILACRGGGSVEARNEFVDGGLHRYCGFVEAEAPAGAEHCSAEQSHRPRPHDSTVVVPQRYRGTSIRDEFGDLITVGWLDAYR